MLPPASTRSVREQLASLSRQLGDPARDYVILAEGNSSARHDDETFWVKASGAQMGTADAAGYVRVRFDGVRPMLEAGALEDSEIKTRLQAATVEGAEGAVPSVETLIHAICLEVDGVRFVGHTHPTAINQITCARNFFDLVAGRIFPDEIVVCGPAPVLVPYRDPGLPLAREIAVRIQAYLESRGERPRLILLQNHGMFALGMSAAQVEQITAMAVKAARILAGAAALGGPEFLTRAAVERIHTRPDEHYRQGKLDS
jgi:rhamnose utilization protein RhaD (predicted bifunctional aldolase and dehydrogenase)